MLREVLRKEAEAQFQLRPGVSRKQISNHLGKLHFTPRTPGDRSGKDSDSDRDPYLKPLDDDDEDLIGKTNIYILVSLMFHCCSPHPFLQRTKIRFSLGVLYYLMLPLLF